MKLYHDELVMRRDCAAVRENRHRQHILSEGWFPESPKMIQALRTQYVLLRNSRPKDDEQPPVLLSTESWQSQIRSRHKVILLSRPASMPQRSSPSLCIVLRNDVSTRQACSLMGITYFARKIRTRRHDKTAHTCSLLRHIYAVLGRHVRSFGDLITGVSSIFFAKL